jgi:hypothetical protein
MKKLSAKCISCITYIFAGEKWSKLSDMKIVTGASCSRRQRWASAESGGVNCFSPGINNRNTIGAAKEKTSSGKSCARNALDDFKTLIALLRMSNFVAHKILADAEECFNGHRMKSHCFAVGGMTAAKAGSCNLVLIPRHTAVVKPNKAFYSILKLLPVSHSARFQFGGWINGSNKKTFCSENELCLLNAS